MRVVMVTEFPGLPWEIDWAKAAATTTELIRITKVGRLSWPAVPGLPFLARSPDDPLLYQLRVLRWRPSRILGRIGLRLTARRYEAAVRHVARTHGSVDLVHGHYGFYLSSNYLPRLRHRLGLPYVVTEHHTGWYRHPSTAQPSAAGIRHARRLFAEASRVVVVCEPLRRTLLETGFTGTFRVIHNPVDWTDFPAPTPAPAGARGPVGDRLEVLSVGRLSAAKGFDVLLDALAAARERDQRLHLTVVGDGPDRGALQERCARLGLDRAVDFAGYLSRAEIVAALARSHLFVLASRVENLTVAVIEALGAGVPVVTTDVGGHREIMRPHLGRLVPAEDVPALADAIVDVAADLHAYDPERIAAQTRERFSVETIGRQLGELYRTAVPTAVPTDVPTAVPTDVPTAVPTDGPTAGPTADRVRSADPA